MHVYLANDIENLAISQSACLMVDQPEEPELQANDEERCQADGVMLVSICQKNTAWSQAEPFDVFVNIRSGLAQKMKHVAMQRFATCYTFAFLPFTKQSVTR